jgi:hypothetical protein
MLTFLKVWFATTSGQELYKIFRDAVEGAVTALLVLNWSIPGDLTQAKAEALTAGTVVFAAVVAVVRRELIPWLASKLGS